MPHSALRDFNNEKHNAIKSYEENIIGNRNTNPKRFYKYCSSNDKYRDNTINLKKEGSIETDPQVCANIMNDFFGSVYVSGPSDTANLPQLSANSPDIEDVEFTEDKVREKINNLDIHKSCGPDGISAFLIKTAQDVFIPILTKFFKRSYISGCIPKSLKYANVTPIFKKGVKTDPNNYRPVSITSIVAKIMESIIKDNIENHITRNNIMHPSQHGFRKGKSTSTNLIEFWNDITDYAENKKSASIIYTDLAKAFDSVPYDLLLYILEKYGIRGNTLMWFNPIPAGGGPYGPPC